MFYLNYIIIKLFVIILTHDHSNCQRRITGGKRVNVDKPYMVYLIWDMEPNNEKRGFYKELRDYNAICGGVIISSNYVLTSAACLVSKPKQYVIAGYNKYVPFEMHENDQCIMKTRRRIIRKCFSKEGDSYNPNSLAFYYREWYLAPDYAAVQVDRPYDFSDQLFLTDCSYIPSTIKVYTEEVPVGSQILTYGWGSPKYHRPEGYDYDVNLANLMGTSSIVVSKHECRNTTREITSKRFESLICTHGHGKLDFNGTYVGQNDPPERRSNSNSTPESDTPSHIMDIRSLPKNDKLKLLNESKTSTRRLHSGGPCQNDHGGPLIYYSNGEEYVAGIVMGYLVNKHMECVGPFFFQTLEDKFFACTTDIYPERRSSSYCAEYTNSGSRNVFIEDINWD